MSEATTPANAAASRQGRERETADERAEDDEQDSGRDETARDRADHAALAGDVEAGEPGDRLTDRMAEGEHREWPEGGEAGWVGRVASSGGKRVARHGVQLGDETDHSQDREDPAGPRPRWRRRSGARVGRPWGRAGHVQTRCVASHALTLLTRASPVGGSSMRRSPVSLALMSRRLGWVVVGIMVVLAAGCSTTSLTVPHRGFSGSVEALAVRSTLGGIEVFENEACPWIKDHVLLVVSTEASVDPDGPTLVSKGARIAVGDSFETAPPVPLEGGYNCGGRHWDQAVHLPSAPSALG